MKDMLNPLASPHACGPAPDEKVAKDTESRLLSSAPREAMEYGLIRIGSSAPQAKPEGGIAQP